eukprot:TRINITY_DN1561_c0_g1_i1.p1 TRINITY_DN1561_c0_g1~~TRINITY_DN1561_c0_g1_i1.p1  ORF type:complete len:321 (+),score=42.04 TRINITY_DN1561_c0_g1_i1:394-1356(+)
MKDLLADALKKKLFEEQFSWETFVKAVNDVDPKIVAQAFSALASSVVAGAPIPPVPIVTDVLETGVRTVVAALARPDATLETLLDAWLVLVKTTTNATPCLIIDEANEPLSPSSDSARNFDVRATLGLLTGYSKERCRLNAILVTSDYSYPSHLTDLKFNLGNFTKMEHVGEVAPRAMKTFLTAEMEIGPNLSDALMAVYGGHLRSIESALGVLPRLSPFKADHCFPHPCCVYGGVDQEKDFREHYRAMATKGYSALISPAGDSEEVKAICHKYVGFVAHNFTQGLVVAIGTDLVYLMPALQMTRLGLAYALTQEGAPER